MSYEIAKPLYFFLSTFNLDLTNCFPPTFTYSPLRCRNSSSPCLLGNLGSPQSFAVPSHRLACIGDVSHVLGIAEWEWFWDELVKDTGKSILCWFWFCSAHDLCTEVFWRDLLFVKWLHLIKACWLDIYVTLLPLLSWDLCWVFCCNPLPFPKQHKTKQDKKPNPKIPQNTFQHWTPVKWELEWWSNFSKTSSASGEVTAH